MIRQIFRTFLFLVFTTSSAYAIDLGTAKNNGLVGETANGYIAAVKSPSGDVNALIQSINGQRKAKYKQIAQKNGTSLNAVESLAGKKAIDKTQKGHYVLIGGKWKKK